MKFLAAACLVGTISGAAVDRAPDGCMVKLMTQIGQDMAKCDQLSDVEEFKCVTSTFKKFFTGAVQCIAGREAVNRSPDGCMVNLMTQIGQDMAKCDQLSDVEEFKCVTSTFKKFFTGAAQCIAGREASNRSPDGCMVNLMTQIGQDMAKCDQLSDVEEFKCVTSTFKKFFTGAAQCIAGKSREGEMKCEVMCIKDLDEGVANCSGNDNEVAKCELDLMREWFSCSMRCFE